MARRQRNIYKRKDGRYEARFIKSRDINGKAIYGSVYAKTYTKVKEKLEAAKMSVSEETIKIEQKEEVVSAVESYLEAHKILIKPSTYWVYHGYIERHIKPYFANMDCSRLNQALLQAYVSEKLENGLSASMIQSVFTFLKKGLEGMVEANIFHVIFPKRNNRKIDVLSLVEQKRLEAMAEASDDTNRVGILLCLYTGIRIGELCGLMWQDVDLDSKTLHICRTMQRVKCKDNSNTKTKIIFLPPKSKSSQRTIPLPEFLLDILRDHHKRSRCEYMLSKGGRAIEPRVMQYRFQRLSKLAGLRPRSFHITRHCFAVRALEKGFDLKTLSEILGHSSPVVTLKKYAHVLDEHKRKSMDSLAAVYGNKNSEHGQKTGQTISEMP